MKNTFNIEHLPSKTFDAKLTEIIYSDDIIQYITNNQAQEANTWDGNLYAYIDNYFNKFPVDTSEHNPNKRCRDLVRTLNHIKKNIDESEHKTSYEFIGKNIDSIINTFINRGYDACSINDNKEDSDELSNKEFDDSCEDITYVKYNSCQINNSINCEEIKKHFQEQIQIFQAINAFKKPKYTEILKICDFTTQDNLENILKVIDCTPCENSASPFSRTDVSISVVISILGLTLMGFLCYRRSPLGHWFNTKILKNNKNENNILDEITSELSEDPSEWSYRNSPNVGYNINYHDSGVS
ncbi:PIR protein [Plasmodium ovale]|uniref:PIR protein n=1 Tax=Plasmodium ovale TaxID=36330 RepID=A0A1C3KJP6_PLAOA|nr:PIR protein [Plasmodium ovale]